MRVDYMVLYIFAYITTKSMGNTSTTNPSHSALSGSNHLPICHIGIDETTAVVWEIANSPVRQFRKYSLTKG